MQVPPSLPRVSEVRKGSGLPDYLLAYLITAISALDYGIAPDVGMSVDH